jgi:hypothetical protein
MKSVVMNKVTAVLGILSLAGMISACGWQSTVDDAVKRAEAANTRAQTAATSADASAAAAKDAAARADANANAATDAANRAKDAADRVEAAFRSSVTK